MLKLTEKVMQTTFSNDKPLFLQLADIIKGEIISGKYEANTKLPSVRDFALAYSINPNTVQKASRARASVTAPAPVAPNASSA